MHRLIPYIAGNFFDQVSDFQLHSIKLDYSGAVVFLRRPWVVPRALNVGFLTGRLALEEVSVRVPRCRPPSELCCPYS